MGYHFHFILQWLISMFYMFMNLQRPEKEYFWVSEGVVEPLKQEEYWSKGEAVCQWVGPKGRGGVLKWAPWERTGKGRYLRPQLFTLTLNQWGVLTGHMPNSPGGRSCSAPSFTSTCMFPSQTHLQLLIIPHGEIGTSVTACSTTIDICCMKYRNRVDGKELGGCVVQNFRKC